MSNARIERTCDRDRGITAAEIEAGIAETKRRMAQPGYAKAERKRLAEIERRSKGRGIKFPDLLNRGTKPTADPLNEVRDAAARFGVKPT